jgi:DNA-binding transcriptional LysR family regulator
VEIREIEAFLMLAEELHFGHAAERLGVTPGRVSQLIRSLERRTGGQLVVRSSREVRLTRIGEQFRADARHGYEHLQRGIDTAQAAATRDRGVLLVGASRMASVPAVTELCEAFEHRYPHWHIQRVTTNGHEMWEPLHKGDADALFGRLPCPPESAPDQPGVVLGPVVTREERVVLAAADYPLAGRSSVDVEELAGHAVVRWADILPAWFVDAWAPPATPSGRRIPRGEEVAVESEEFYDQIVRRGLLHVAPASALDIIPWPRVAAVPLTGLPPFHIVLALRRGTRNAVTDAFASMVTRRRSSRPDMTRPGPAATRQDQRPPLRSRRRPARALYGRAQSALLRP